MAATDWTSTTVTIPTVPNPTGTALTTSVVPINTGWSPTLGNLSTATFNPVYFTALGREEVKAMVKEAVTEMFAEMLGKDE